MGSRASDNAVVLRFATKPNDSSQRAPGTFLARRTQRLHRRALTELFGGFTLFVLGGMAGTTASTFATTGRPATMLFAIAWVMCAVGALAMLAGQDRVDAVIRYRKGRDGERKVGQALEALKADGWVVMHDVEVPYGGNIDHVVIGPRGAFAIETKSHWLRRGAHVQAKAGAGWLESKLDVRTAPIVVSANFKSLPSQNFGGRVWSMGLPHLIRHLRKMTCGAPVDVEAARRRLLAVIES
jgi:hypothetical protein